VRVPAIPASRRTGSGPAPVLIVLLVLAVAADAQEVKPRVGSTTGVRTPTDSIRRTTGTTSGTTTGATTSGGTTGTTGSTGTSGGSTSPTGSTADPGARYRVTLNGFTVLRQSYDHPLELDGKGDEIYFAAYVARVDTASPTLIEHGIVRSRVMGDINGFMDRERMGQRSDRGGIATAFRYPASNPYVRSGAPSASRLPMTLWEGTLVHGRSAVIVSPTVWEWDGNAELFGYWVASRGVVADRLTMPDVLLATINNRNWFAQELGSPGFQIRTDMFADARDRPIGLELGRAAPAVPFLQYQGGTYAPAKAGTGTSAGTDGASFLLSVVESARRELDRWRTILDFFPAGRAIATFASTGLQRLPFNQAIAQDRRESLAQQVAQQRQAASGGIIRVLGLPAMLNTVRNVVRDYTATEVFFIERSLVLTPAAIEEALRSASRASGRPPGAVDVTYVDHGPLQGRYVLHLQLERLP
jgi:hypothetical protein